MIDETKLSPAPLVVVSEPRGCSVAAWARDGNGSEIASFWSDDDAAYFVLCRNWLAVVNERLWYIMPALPMGLPRRKGFLLFDDIGLPLVTEGARQTLFSTYTEAMEAGVVEHERRKGGGK